MPEYPCAGPIDVAVRALAGTVRVIAEDRTTATIDVWPVVMSEAGRTVAAETRIEMNGSELLVEVPPSHGFNIRRHPALNISIRVPLDSRLHLRSASSDMVCGGRYGSSDFHTASGDLRVEHVAGDCRRRTSSGDTQFGRVDGDFDVNGASADLRGTSIGGDLTSKSASGNIAIDTIDGSVRASSASGDIRIGSLVTGTTRLNAVSGNVSIGVAGGTAVWLDLNSVSGDTRTDLAVSETAPSGMIPTLNLHIRTTSGDIAVRRARTGPSSAQVSSSAPEPTAPSGSGEPTD